MRADLTGRHEQRTDHMAQKIILETERLFLREMSMDDFDALYKVLADQEIMCHYPYVFDEERVRSWIERNMKRYADNGFGLWAVCLKETGEMIGDCGLTLQNIEGEMLPLFVLQIYKRRILQDRRSDRHAFREGILRSRQRDHTCVRDL